MKSGSSHELVKLISICGQVAEHKSEKMRENGRDEAMIVAGLSEEEQNTLKELLTKLQAQWLKDHAEHHRRQAQEKDA